jgi:hypothetical protein
MKKIAKWVMIVLLMAFVAGCAASTSSDLSYSKVRAENPGLAGGVGDLHPNQKQ